MKKWHMRIACWILTATNTHKGCATHIAFPLTIPVLSLLSTIRPTPTALAGIAQLVQ